MYSPLPLTIAVVNSMGKVENSTAIESNGCDEMVLQAVQVGVMVLCGGNGPRHFRENYAPDLVLEHPVKYSITKK